MEPRNFTFRLFFRNGTRPDDKKPVRLFPMNRWYNSSLVYQYPKNLGTGVQTLSNFMIQTTLQECDPDFRKLDIRTTYENK